MSRGSERSITTSTSNNYKLIKNLDVELATFKLQEHTAQAETHDIIAALTDWLRKVSPEMKADENIVSIWLGDFFDARGVDVLFDIDELRADTIKNSGLSDHVLKNIPRYSRSNQMLQNDIDAISYIILQRDGMRYETIESCQSISIAEPMIILLFSAFP